jgi:hypothetical protein
MQTSKHVRPSQNHRSLSEQTGEISWYKRRQFHLNGIEHALIMAKRKRNESSDLPAPKKRHGSTSSQADAAQPVPSVKQNIGFLDLPGKVRNIIYKHALTAESGKIKLDIPISSPSRFEKMPFREFRRFQHEDPLPPEFNQLKYVCRQLYQDTACLELQYNSLIFMHMARAELEPDRQLVEFKRLCSPAKFAWIQRIEVHTQALAMAYNEILLHFLMHDHVESYVRTAQFCRNHPKIEFKYVLNSFNWLTWSYLGPESCGFISQGIILLKALRNVDSSHLDPRHASRLLAYGARCRSRSKKESWYADNLKFYPRQDELDGDDFRRRAGRSAENVDGGVDTWVVAAKAWIEDGF